MKTTCIASVKLVKSKIPGHHKVLIAFGTKSKNEFPRQKDCAYVSGDVQVSDIDRVLAAAAKVLRTENFQIFA